MSPPLEAVRLSLSVNAFPHAQLVLDASALINFLGCGRHEEMLGAFGEPCLIPDRTLREVKRIPGSTASAEKALSALLRAGRLVTRSLDDQEYETFLSLVSGEPQEALDVGESAAIAVSFHRGLPIVLDDGKARRRVNELFPKIVVTTSLRSLIAAGQRLGWEKADIAKAILSAHTLAKMNTVKGDEALLVEFGLRAKRG